MSITKKIIVTDTNIITDLSNAKILKQFVALDNVYISDMILNDEINSKTCDINIKNFKVLQSSSKQLLEVSNLANVYRKLSIYDLLNYVLARDNNGILATGDNRLKKFSETKGIEVIRTLKIIELMVNNNVISYKEAITACELLKNNSDTRIPLESINELMKKLSVYV